MAKLISVIIATYNAAQTLENCLNSIIPQLNDQCELIIIDGKSKDETCSLIDKYKESIAYTVSEKDKGVYDAWNKGIKAARGKWIMFVGADDLLLEGAVDSYLEFLNTVSDDTDYICARNEYVTENNIFLKNIGTEWKWDIFRYQMDVAHVGSLHRRRLFDEVGCYNLDFKICADYELLMRKKSALKSRFFDHGIARMQTGGMSYSVRAIKEAYSIKELHNSISPLDNRLNYMKNVVVFQLSRVKAYIKGRK